jgi:AI-2 transport protein TqsA
MLTVNVSCNRMIALIAIILAAAALRASYPVTMPLAVSALLIAAIWPVKLWFDRTLPKVAYLGTGLVLLVILALFFSALYFSAAQVVQAFGENWGELEKVYQVLTRWLQNWGPPGYRAG